MHPCHLKFDRHHRLDRHYCQCHRYLYQYTHLDLREMHLQYHLRHHCRHHHLHCFLFRRYLYLIFLSYLVEIYPDHLRLHLHHRLDHTCCLGHPHPCPTGLYLPLECSYQHYYQYRQHQHRVLLSGPEEMHRQDRLYRLHHHLNHKHYQFDQNQYQADQN